MKQFFLLVVAVMGFSGASFAIPQYVCEGNRGNFQMNFMESNFSGKPQMTLSYKNLEVDYLSNVSLGINRQYGIHVQVTVQHPLYSSVEVLFPHAKLFEEVITVVYLNYRNHNKVSKAIDVTCRVANIVPVITSH